MFAIFYFYVHIQNMIHVTGETNWETLVDQVRHVSLLQPRDGELIYPYQNADISLQEISYTDVRPTSLYALRGNLAFQQALSEALAPDHDPLLLNGALQLANDEGSPMGLLPPIVEYTDERGKYILDGLHRTFMGYRAGRTAFNAIYIRNFRDDCPASALRAGRAGGLPMRSILTSWSTTAATTAWTFVVNRIRA